MDIFTIPTTKYYASGRLKFESRHEDGLIVVNEWYPNGEKLRECFRDMKTLKFVGMRKEYNHIGIINREIPYNTNGELDGIERGYYPDGRVKYELHHKNGKIVKQVMYDDTD